MTDTAATDDTPVRAYGRLLLRLHDLIARGLGDDPEADAVRDQMDGPWHALTEAAPPARFSIAWRKVP